MNNGVNNNQIQNNNNTIKTNNINNNVNVPNQTITAQTQINSTQQINQSNPQIIQSFPTQPQPTNNVQIQNQKENKEKKQINLLPILLLIIIVLVIFNFFNTKNYKTKLANLNYNCSPITSKEKFELDTNSTLIKDLYSKVYTNIREDIAQPEFNDNMRIYLAYRQILESEKYDSNCNNFSNLSMEPYKCEVSTTFKPKAFKQETMIQAIKKLYGENTEIPLSNIKLGNSCIGGYQYIASRGEFVQGFCNQQTATSYRATKKLISATSTKNTIILKEEVKYHENEGMSLPSYLKSGTYYYTFRLDTNYNYVLVKKTYESKY